MCSGAPPSLVALTRFKVDVRRSIWGEYLPLFWLYKAANGLDLEPLRAVRVFYYFKAFRSVATSLIFNSPNIKN